MKYLKNIIYKKINFGFSLFEIIMSITIGSFILLTIVTGMFVLYRGFNTAKNDSVRIMEISKFTNMIIRDVLNPDLFPHHPKQSDDETDDVYTFDSKSIIFFANKKKVEYNFIDETDDYFEIIYNEEELKKFSFIKDFQIKYYDINDFEIIDFGNDSYIEYCELLFKFYDNTSLKLNMKL